MKLLIVGQSGGNPAFDVGPSANRLARWFGTTPEQLALCATMVNVADFAGMLGKGDKYKMNLTKIEHAGKLAEDADLVFLVGRVAQKTFVKNVPSSMLWQTGKFRGVPHPSGINHQLNNGGDARTKQWIQDQLKEASK